MAVYKFEDIAFNSTEKKKPVEEDKYTYLGLEHLDSDSIYVTRFGADVAPKGEKLLMKKGDVLFGKRRAYQKKVAIAPFDGIFSAHGMVLRPKEEVIDKDFFPLFIKSDYFLDEAIKISVGSLSPTINWRDLKELKFSLPGLEEQKKLAQVLWSIYETKEEYKKLIRATDDLVKSQFIEITTAAGCKSIAEIAINYGRGKSPNYIEYSDIKVINQACIYWDGIHYENVKYQNSERFNDKNILKNDAVLINATGTGTLGRSIVFPGVTGEKYMADSHVMVVEVNAQMIHPRFFQIFLSLPNSQSTIYTDCVNGSTNQIELSKEAFGKMQVPIIDIELQKQFVEFAQQSDKSKFMGKLTGTHVGYWV